MTDAVLQITDLRAGYGAVPVLFDVSLEVRAREIVTLVGSNGAGKTTLLRALARVIPSRGRILFDGKDIGALTSVQPPLRAQPVEQRFKLGRVAAAVVVQPCQRVLEVAALGQDRSRGAAGSALDRRQVVERGDGDMQDVALAAQR